MGCSAAPNISQKHPAYAHQTFEQPTILQQSTPLTILLLLLLLLLLACFLAVAAAAAAVMMVQASSNLASQNHVLFTFAASI